MNLALELLKLTNTNDSPGLHPTVTSMSCQTTAVDTWTEDRPV